MQLTSFPIPKSETILLAVSGGVDSVVMIDLYWRSGQKIALAHCNFQLRGAESDADEQLVIALADQYEIPVHTIQFDTENIAKNNKKSIQITARELRYQWFAEVCQVHHYTAIATAHHANDNIETFCYNFAKGCGIRGLTGIPAHNDNIIRPMLHFSKQAIYDYAQQHQLEWREDASNASTKYARNAIRHQIIPVLKGINSNLENTANINFKRLQETAWLFEYAVEQLKAQYVQELNGIIQIDRQVLTQHPSANTLLYEWLKPYGFNNSQIQQALAASVKTGAIFPSDNWRLLVNRAYFLIQANTTIDTIPMSLANTGTFVYNQLTIQLQEHQGKPNQYPTVDHITLASLQAEDFPLSIRPWRAGDYFHPIGMKGKKQKLKSFLANKKLSIFEKENTFVITTVNDTIVWVVNHRLDERFKITPNTKSYYRFECL